MEVGVLFFFFSFFPLIYWLLLSFNFLKYVNKNKKKRKLRIMRILKQGKCDSDGLELGPFCLGEGVSDFHLKAASSSRLSNLFLKKKISVDLGNFFVFSVDQDQDQDQAWV